jgi:hypothetical protein
MDKMSDLKLPAPLSIPKHTLGCSLRHQTSNSGLARSRKIKDKNKIHGWKVDKSSTSCIGTIG